MTSQALVDMPPLLQTEKVLNVQDSSEWLLDVETFEWLLGSRVEPAPLQAEGEPICHNSKRDQ